MGYTDRNISLHSNTKSYVTGFILSIILTAISFGVVMSGSTSNLLTIFVIIASGITQILVHLIFFLYVNAKFDFNLNFNAFIFTVSISTILVTGSIWIMSNLNHNMIID